MPIRCRPQALYRLLGIAALLSLSCTTLYNPFEDEANCRAYFAATEPGLMDGDTVGLYQTRTVYVSTLLPALIDSFRFLAPASRISSDTTLVYPAEGPHSFQTSFFDTGMQKISLSTFRPSGQTTLEYLTVRVVSHLAQRDIDTVADAQIHFTTPAVPDSAWYHWSYGYPLTQTVHSPVSEFSVRVPFAGTLPGSLWVSSDPSGLSHCTPRVTFSIRLDDLDGPFITPLADSVSHDTIRVADVDYALDFLITDVSGVGWATVNGVPFDETSPPRYTIILHHLDRNPVSSPRNLKVRAVDTRNQLTTRTLWVIFDPSAPSARSTCLDVDGLSGSERTAANTITITGQVTDRLRPQIRIKAINGRSDDSSIAIVPLTNGRGYWGMTLPLHAGENTLTISASDISGSELAVLSRTVYRDSSCIDSLKPQILNLLVDGQTVEDGHTYFTQYDTANVSIRLFDLSGIASANWNNNPFLQVDTALWQATVHALRHDRSLPVSIEAADPHGNKTVTGFLLRRNHRPQLDNASILPVRFVAGANYDIPLAIIDEDPGVIVQVSNAPAGMTIAARSLVNEWVITWLPQLSDTGAYETTMLLHDGLEIVSLRWAFTVQADTAGVIHCAPPTGLKTVYQAGRDTLTANFGSLDGSGTAPFQIRADWNGHTLTDTLSTTKYVTVSWAPSSSDTGLGTLVWSVTDALGNRDTDYRDLSVVAANRFLCTLSVNAPAAVPLLADSSWLVSATNGPDTFAIQIHDTDNPLTEAYHIKVFQDGTTVSRTTRFANPVIVIAPPISPSSTDTVLVSVSDSTGSRVSSMLRFSW